MHRLTGLSLAQMLAVFADAAASCKKGTPANKHAKKASAVTPATVKKKRAV